jgi:hypothetical protein
MGVRMSCFFCELNNYSGDGGVPDAANFKCKLFHDEFIFKK